MPFIPIEIPPGIVKADSEYALMGRWVDADKVRFYKGFPQKIGGISKLANDQFTGYARGASAWVPASGQQYLAFGTEADLFIWTNDALSTITPFRGDASGITLTDPFSTTNASPIVNVYHAGHGIAEAGVTVIFSGATAVGGITIDETYTVTAIVDADNFTITHGSNATSTAGPGGGSVTASYEINPDGTSATYTTGWGASGWGTGGWGAPTSPALSTIVEARWWTFGAYGEDQIICPLDGTLYHYDTSGGVTRPSPISNAPVRVRCTMTTPERFIFALGCTTVAGVFDPMTVRWPHQTDMTDWTPSSTNTSNERKLQGGSRLMGGTSLTGGLSLVWSDFGVFAFQYTGSDLIYDSRMIGANCGLVGPMAFCQSGAAAFWMGVDGFYMYSGYVDRVPNQEDISDWVFGSINVLQANKVTCYYSRKFNEVWWFFPTDTDEITKYVHVNIDTYAWVTGTMARSCITSFPLSEYRPVMFGYDGYIYLHDDPNDVNDDESAMRAYLKMGMFDLDQGNRTVDIFGYVPDFQRQSGDITVTITGRDHPMDSAMMTDTVTVAEGDKIADVKTAGRQITLELESNAVGGDFRLGKHGVEIVAAGRKR